MRQTRFFAAVFSLILLGTTAAFAGTTAKTTEGTSSKGTTGTKPGLSRPQTRSSITISCPDGKHFALATGTPTGNCEVLLSNNGTVIGGSCIVDGNNGAEATCGAGCTITRGTGSCCPTN